MKTTIVRAFVVALAITGVSASAVSAKNTKHEVKGTTTLASAPGCLPGHPGNCGLGTEN